MDDEKPFPIEWIVLLMIVALANDVAEIICDLIDATGIGIASEAIMEPVDFVLDFFFTGIFIWKLGFGGGTITQYIGDLLEPLFIPGRTIAVGIGIWMANHPKSVVSSAANVASSFENPSAAGKALNVAEGTASGLASEAGAIATDASGRRLMPGQEDNEFDGLPTNQQPGDGNTGTPADSMQGREEKSPMENLEGDLYSPEDTLGRAA